jgi:hypothetical protein
VRYASYGSPFGALPRIFVIHTIIAQIVENVKDFLRVGGKMIWIWIVRTELSNFNNFVVHFFDTRQMKRCFGCAETQRKRA